MLAPNRLRHDLASTPRRKQHELVTSPAANATRISSARHRNGAGEPAFSCRLNVDVSGRMPLIDPSVIGVLGVFATGLAAGAALEPVFRAISQQWTDAHLPELTPVPDIVPAGHCAGSPVSSAMHTSSAKKTEPQALWQTPERHAQALLEWLQSPGGLTGELAAGEVELIYADMCTEMRWALRPWSPVARELRKLLGGEKSYAWRDGHRVRVYRIPLNSVVLQRVPLRKAA